MQLGHRINQTTVPDCVALKPIFRTKTARVRLHQTSTDNGRFYSEIVIQACFYDLESRFH